MQAKKPSDVWPLVSHYMGPINALISNNDLTEVCVNNYQTIFVEQDGAMQRVDASFPNEFSLQNLIIQMAHALNQPCSSETHPILDARLPDGSRICGVLPPIAVNGPCLTIRVAPKQRFTPYSLLEKGMLSKDLLDLCRTAILKRANIIISGGTGSGKTTVLSTLSQFIPPQDRIITVEDTHELHLDLPHVVSLEAPKRSSNGSEATITLASLIKTTLRMKPDRILVGEIRDAEAAMAFLHAINTGHRGTCTTLHANNALDAISRIQTLVASQGLFPYEVIRTLVTANIDLLIHIEKIPGTGRRVTQIVQSKEQRLNTLWEYKA